MIAWDTETTGIPPKFKPTPANVAEFAKSRIVSLAAVRYSGRGREIKTFYRLIRPDGYDHMPPGAENVHKISFDQACVEGVPFEQAFGEFRQFCANDPLMVAYNSQFDEKMMLSEILRYGLDTAWWLDHTFTCCFELYKQINCVKRGKLEVVYPTVFGRAFDAHNSLADSRACGELYFYLLDQKTRVLNTLPPHIRSVTINASDCATAIGRGIDEPQEVVKNLWAKYSPETFAAQTFEQKARELIRGQTDIRKLYFDDVRRFKTNSSNVLQERIKFVSETIEKRPLEDLEKKTLKRYMTGELQKKFARSSSSHTLETRILPLCDILGTNYQVCGRPGEIRDGVLFVVKNRTGRFMGVRDYEEVQCRVYLEMCPPETTTCCLVEKFQGQTRFHSIERDLETWEDIKLRLHNFCEYFHSVVSV